MANPLDLKSNEAPRRQQHRDLMRKVFNLRDVSPGCHRAQYRREEIRIMSVEARKMRGWKAGLLLMAIACCASCAKEESAADEQEASASAETQAAMVRPAVAAGVPVISPRNYTGGQAIVKVSGAFQFDATIPLNQPASISDGEMTWLQYGASGAESPNALITISTQEIGLSVSQGKRIATAGAAECSGGMKVESASVSGKYSCADVTSYDPTTGAMGKVSFEIEFGAAT
jgi:hypothetical protein